MRNTLQLIGLALIVIFTSSRVKAQTLLDSVIVEKYHIATANDTVGRPGLTIGAVTYRIYVDLNNTNGAQLQGIYSDDNHGLSFKTTSSFYNDMNKGGKYGENVKTGSLYDSYISFGGATTSSTFGVYKSTDITGTPEPTGSIGFAISGINSLTSAFNSTTSNAVIDYPATNSVMIYDNNAGGTVTGPTVENRVLIGQFTTDGTFSYSFALLLTDGNIQEAWVASDATTNANGQLESANSTLSGTIVPNVPPTISITSSSTAISGDAITINATATDDNKVSKVEFFIDGTSISSSTTSPYSATWTASTGTHSITAVATDNDGASTTSNAVSVVVAAASLSAPSTVSIDKAGTATSVDVKSNISWTASTTDTWLTIDPTTEKTGDYTLSISATVNTADTRIGTITLSSTRSTSKTITVTQASGLTLPTISLSAASATIGETANSTTTFDITSNATWTVTSSEVWLTFNPATGTNGGTVTLTAAANTGATRTATVTITSGSVSKTITITQSGITAVKEIKNQAIVIYPNPCKSSFVINSDENAIVTIYSFIGEKLQTLNASAHEKIAIDMLPSGIYFVSILINNIEYTQKLLKE